MTREDLIDAIDGLHAYDTGATDSGIKDEALRQRCKEAISAMGKPELMLIVRDMTLNDEWIEHGATLEDAIELADWLMDLGAPRLMP